MVRGRLPHRVIARRWLCAAVIVLSAGARPAALNQPSPVAVTSSQTGGWLPGSFVALRAPRTAMRPSLIRPDAYAFFDRRQLAAPGAAGALAADLALWIRDTAQWPRYRHLDRVGLDESVTLEMSVGDTRTLLPIMTGSAASSNSYVDLCVPVEEIEVPPSSTWAPADPERWDCARYSAYIPGGPQSERSPAEPLRFRALAAGTFPFRYRIMTADAPPVEGEFRVVVAPTE